MRIRGKIFAIAGALSAATVVLCGMGFYAAEQSRSMTQLTNSEFAKVVVAEKMHRFVVDVAFNTRGTWMSKDTAEAKPYVEKMISDLTDIDVIVMRLKGQLDEVEAQQFDKVLSVLKPFIAERKQ